MFNFHRGWELKNQHDHRFIVLGHGPRDIMWKRSIDKLSRQRLLANQSRAWFQVMAAAELSRNK